jgi:HNH endonuclease
MDRQGTRQDSLIAAAIWLRLAESQASISQTTAGRLGRLTMVQRSLRMSVTMGNKGKGSSIDRRLKRNELFWMQNGRCIWCEAQVAAEDATLDEIVPRGRGGTSAWGNVVMACWPCNQARGHSAPPPWAIRRAKSMAAIRRAAFHIHHVLAGTYTQQNTTQEKT